MNADLAAAKKELRTIVKARLKALQIDRIAAARKLYQNLVSLPCVKQAKTIGVFIDFGTEIPVRYFLRDLYQGPGFTRVVGIPWCDGADMTFFKLQKPDVDPDTDAPIFRDLVPGAFGILEPSPEDRAIAHNLVKPEDIDVMVAPGLAFDLQGRRLGRGAGYYDRYLPKLRSDATIVGIGYEEQLVDEAPAGELDFRLHALVTPERAVFFN